MSHVSVTINGRQYRMACDDGQEEHLARMASELDQRIERLRASFGEIGDMRLTVMAALLISDELGEASQRLHQCETELNELRGAREDAAQRMQKANGAIAAALDSAAARIENLTDSLNQAGDSQDVPVG
jgi:cell division protein ZapA